MKANYIPGVKHLVDVEEVEQSVVDRVITVEVRKCKTLVSSERPVMRSYESVPCEAPVMLA